ncbi:MAG: betI [Anaerosporomusa subterranea]|jgi:AcrR family transcriptional regulator|nr:betI [Anaerosporomusa subterranea]
MKIEVPIDKPTVCKIIKAAVPLFAMKGVAAVSVKELAEAAGVNVALISYYFGGKDNLYAFVLEHQLAILDDSLNVIQQEETCPVAKIRRMAITIAHLHKENPYLDRLFYSEMTNPTKWFEPFILNAADKLHSFLKDCIVEAISQGQFRSDLQPDFAAISLLKILNLSLITLLVSKELLPPDDDPIEVYIIQALDIYLRGVSNP